MHSAYPSALLLIDLVGGILVVLEGRVFDYRGCIRQNERRRAF